MTDLVVPVIEDRSTDTKPNTNENQGKIPKPNLLKGNCSPFHVILSEIAVL